MKKCSLHVLSARLWKKFQFYCELRPKRRCLVCFSDLPDGVLVYCNQLGFHVSRTSTGVLIIK